jgi:signal transduction histidine kinase
VSFAVILILCNIATVILAILAMVHTERLRKMRSARWLLVLTAWLLIGSCCSLGIFIGDGLEEKVTFFYLRAMGTIFFPVCWLYFVSAIFGRWNWLHKKWVMVFMLAPSTINFLMVAFPATRPLLFTHFQPLSYRGISVVQFELESWYRRFYAWSMILMLCSYVISAIAFAKEQGYRRRQVLILNMGFCAALVSYFFASPENLHWIVASSFSILFTQIGITVAVIRHRLLSAVPLAMVQIFQKLPDPVLVIDDMKRLMGANDKAMSFFGLPENYLGQPIENLLPAVSLTPGELVLKDKSQASHHFHLALEKVGGETESSPGTVIFFRDIGTQKNEELLLNQGLEFRARLLGHFAHDLTGFVESQAVMSQTLQKNVGAEHRQQLELLSSSAQASQDLVGNIMSWAKSQSMQFQPEKNPFEWNCLLQETIEQMQSRLTIKGVAIAFTSTQKPILGVGDSEMLASVFRNILSNSVRATPQGKKIYVSLETKQRHAEIKIRDEGCGMETEKLDRIRELSKEFLLAGVSKTHGSGIGLMIARHFISLHQGHFQIDSSLDSGTEVFFSIPL